MSTGPVPPVEASHAVQGFTVTCQQCGSANMTRLDRKEYKCNHCGAVTVISDTDAEHLEQLLKQMMYRQAALQAPLPVSAAARGRAIAITVGALVFFAAVLSLAVLSSHHVVTAVNPVDNYFAQTTVRADQITMSPLEWIPDGKDGSYNGLVYNHSGYAISPPFYGLVLFHNGVKDGTAESIPLLGTLEPGEYMPVSFAVKDTKPNLRYEVTQPQRVSKTTFDVAAPVVLQQQVFVRQPHLPNYYLVGFVQNTLKRPFSGGGVVMLYDRQGRLIGSGTGNIGSADLNPGEKTKLVMNAWLFDTSSGPGEVARYEYLLDMRFRNERQSVSVEDLKQIGAVTVPNRIVRVNNPHVVVAPDSEHMDPASYLRDE